MRRSGVARALLIVADVPEGGLLGAAVDHRRWLTEAGRSAYLVTPPGASNSGATFSRTIPMPATVRDFRAVRQSAVALRAFWLEVGQPTIHAHGFRAALVSIMATHARIHYTHHGLSTILTGNAFIRMARLGFALSAPLWSISRSTVSPETLPGWQFTPWPSPRLPGLRSSALVEDDLPLYVWIGRLSSQKRPELLAESARQLIDQGHRLRVAFVGDGPMLDRLRNRYASPSIRFEGASSDVSKWLKDARALCLFSHFEGIPFVLQEAMASARPVICTQLTGNRWLLGPAGIYADDVPSVKKAIVDLLDKQHADKIAKAVSARWAMLAGVFHDAPQRIISVYGDASR